MEPRESAFRETERFLQRRCVLACSVNKINIGFVILLMIFETTLRLRDYMRSNIATHKVGGQELCLRGWRNARRSRRPALIPTYTRTEATMEHFSQPFTPV